MSKITDDGPQVTCVMVMEGKGEHKGKWAMGLKYADGECFISKQMFNSEQEAEDYAYKWTLENHVFTERPS